MKYAQQYNLKPADRLVEPLFQTGLTKHHAIFWGEDDYGVEWIVENDMNEGVRFLVASVYFDPNKSIDRIERFHGTEAARWQALQRALSLKGKPYNLISYNCEHFANEVQTGIAESRQVRNVFGGLAALAIIAIIARS